MKKRFLFVVAASATLGAAIATTPQVPVLAEGAGAQFGIGSRTGRDFVAPLVFQASGPSVASLQSTVDQYRLALGANNGNGAGPLTTGRREINWDGGGSATSPGGSPFTVFLNNRGALLTSPGGGFIQAPPSGLATTFGIASYETIFKTFSPQRVFAPTGSNVSELTFFIPGSNGGTEATTNAFGAVYTDIDQPDGSGPGGKRGNRGSSTLVEYFDGRGALLYSSFVAASPGDGHLSFLGIMFADARIARVRITTGDAPLGVEDTDNLDIVVMDDFIYGEPRIGG
ncbi:MAG TPA: hypothetical protein VFO19_14610 [Vicinamibacterales bacterium]|nr:hypothetical protein [Vicinamibacterales bacterium]